MLAPVTIRLSKSKFVAGMQCLKRLYWQVHEPELAAEPDGGQAARLAQGNDVGILARRAFPGGVLVQTEGNELDDAVARTETLLNDRSVPAIFEATFRHKGVLIRVDILQRRPRQRWRLIEVKSALDFKEHYLYDLALQYYVLSGYGLAMSGAWLMHLNRKYICDPDNLRPEDMFILENLTPKVKKFVLLVPKLIRRQRRVLNRQTLPNIEPGPHCSTPFQCEFFDQCNDPVPPDHITTIPFLSDKKRQNLVDLGIDSIWQIPDDFPLTELQRRVCTAVQNSQPWFSDLMAYELSKLKYPVYFMDFESLNPAIPRHYGMRPYSQIPFQWSVYRLDRPGADFTSFDFLSEDNGDPRDSFIRTLCAILGKRGPIIVYNRPFESQRLNELAAWIPKYADRIANLQGRLWDLLAFVRRHVYHPGFQGSFSLKSVAPALIPHLKYTGMEVADGGDAGLAWDRMIHSDSGCAEKERLRLALLGYCRQDTSAMAAILKRLNAGASRRARTAS